MNESFCGRMQHEFLNRVTVGIIALGLTMAAYSQNFHNTRRRHSLLGTLTSEKYETTKQDLLQLTQVRAKNVGHITRQKGSRQLLKLKGSLTNDLKVVNAPCVNDLECANDVLSAFGTVSTH